MIENFYPGFDEAEASKDETKWARRQPDRDVNACEVCNTKTTPPTTSTTRRWKPSTG